ncbi:Cu_bind_like domain-containing protein [Cephalotus follicularis]|uniref:Cu_bind_like domain-containing protein n=1 Tax=Cephalotus follicularis TaxID=3775 RepID=A0A1Q3CQQ5_CEPFO|nr:Cu_bind_like domain-containing protein [Cephalotus follicularis]
MARIMNMALLVVVGVLATAMFQATYAAEYTVGGSRGWTNVNNASFYSDWEEGISFNVGDVLIFNFATGVHDVATVTKADYDACNTANTITTVTTGPARVTLNAAGEHYYICTFTGHCSGGQKINIEVGTSSPTPGSSPTTPGTTTTSPPPPSSASSLVAAFSVILMAISVGFFC